MSLATNKKWLHNLFSDEGRLNGFDPKIFGNDSWRLMPCHRTE